MKCVLRVRDVVVSISLMMIGRRLRLQCAQEMRIDQLEAHLGRQNVPQSFQIWERVDGIACDHSTNVVLIQSHLNFFGFVFFFSGRNLSF